MSGISNAIVAFEPEGPLPLIRDNQKAQPYPVHALGPLREAVEAVQGQTGAPIALPAQSALSVASLAVQAFADVQTLAGFAPTSLYALTIAESGERKSTCDKILMQALRDHERDAAAAQRLDREAWLNKVALWKGERDAILSEAKKGKGEKRVAAEVDLEALGSEPLPPPTAERTVTEPTFEGLTRLFLEGQPSLGIFSDEGGQFLGGYGMNSDNRQKMLTALNDLWGGAPIRRTRAGDGAFTLYGRRLALHLMVQPVIADEFMRDSLAGGSGFLPRCLICHPPSNIGSRLSCNLQDRVAGIAGIANSMSAILKAEMPLRDTETRELDPRKLPLSGQAKEVLIAYSDEVERNQAQGCSLSGVRGYASKSAEQAARIAGVLTLWQDINAAQVELKELEWGIELARYYLSEAARLAGHAALPPEIEKAELLRNWLIECQRQDVWPAYIVQHGPNNLRDTKTIKPLLKVLVDHGWLVAHPEGSMVDGKQRKESYRIVRRAKWES